MPKNFVLFPWSVQSSRTSTDCVVKVAPDFVAPLPHPSHDLCTLDTCSAASKASKAAIMCTDGRAGRGGLNACFSCSFISLFSFLVLCAWVRKFYFKNNLNVFLAAMSLVENFYLCSVTAVTLRSSKLRKASLICFKGFFYYSVWPFVY